MPNRFDLSVDFLALGSEGREYPQDKTAAVHEAIGWAQSAGVLEATLRDHQTGLDHTFQRSGDQVLHLTEEF